MKDTGYWLIGYAYKTDSGGEWHFTNEPINESPGDWLMRVLAEARTTNERYAIVMTLAISKKHYDQLSDKL